MSLVIDWIDALRSGEFRQGKLHCLAENGQKSYDPFGVLGKVGEKLYDFNYEQLLEDYYECGGIGYYMPDILEEKLYISDGAREHILDMNDKRNMSFKEISDYIYDVYLDGEIKEIEE